MAFTAKDVQALREKTGCGMMDCKKALTESNGDMEKAVEFLREKGLAAAAKKSGRIAAEGLVYAIVDEKKKAGVVIEVNSETDFVAKNADFQSFVAACAQTVIDANPADVDALLNTKISGGNETVADALREKILVIGENLKIRRFARYDGTLITYVHGGGRIGVMVKFDTTADASSDAFKEYAKDIAMQVAAANPAYLCEDRVPADVLAKEKEILMAQIANDPKTANKPEAVIAKMVEGKIGKYYKENCLVDQLFVKDPELTITKYTEAKAKELGAPIKIVDYVRFEKGEGLEKREDNFADEVASMIK